ncbi:MAG: hypothetical protein ACT4TC_25630 [Myxococcaceae bacterium]
MALTSLAPATAASAIQTGARESVKPRFSQSLQAAVAQARSEVAPRQIAGATASASKQASGCAPVAASQSSMSVSMGKAANAVDRVAGAQRRLDAVLKLAESGKTFTPGELLSFQAQVYRASQELDLAGKVVEKGTAGVKQVLQTQV